MDVNRSRTKSAWDASPKKDPIKVGERDEKTQVFNAYTLLAVVIAALGAFAFGIDVGVTGPAMDMRGFRDALNWPYAPNSCAGDAADPHYVSEGKGLINGIFNLGALASAPIAGWLADTFGRRLVIAGGGVTFCVGVILQGLSGHLGTKSAFTDMVVGRVIAGFGMGFFLSVIPVYISELVPKRLRGLNVAIFQFMITLGIFISAVINYFFKDNQIYWRFGLSMNAVPALILVVMMFVALPESPRYLVQVGKAEQAQDVLEKLIPDTVSDELGAIVRDIDSAKQAGSVSWGSLFFNGQNLLILIVGVGIQISQQFTGINFFMGYGPSIFNNLCIMDGFVAQIILTLFNCVGTIPGLLLIDHGRKKVLLAGTLGIIFSFGAATILLATVQDMAQDIWAGWLVFVLVLIFQFSFASTWGIAGWTVPAEVFPTPLRGKGAGLATAANQAFNYIMVQISPVLLTSIGPAATFGFFLVINLIFVGPYVWFILPETGRVSLENLNKFVFNYSFSKKQRLENSYGTVGAFFKRNGEQSIKAILCRPITYVGCDDGSEGSTDIGTPAVAENNSVDKNLV